MRPTPTYMVNKIVGSMDPLQPYREPRGGLYRMARGVRDLPFSSPFAAGAIGAGTAVGISLAATAGVATAGLALPVLAGIYGAGALYATATEAVHAAPRFARFLEQIGRGRLEFASPMVDTRAAHTMRQSALRAIHDSGYMTRAVLGREAKLLHR